MDGSGFTDVVRGVESIQGGGFADTVDAADATDSLRLFGAGGSDSFVGGSGSAEARAACSVLDRMTRLGRPVSQRTA